MVCTPCFIKKTWKIIHKSLYQFIVPAFHTSSFPEQINRTTITLIPKVTNADIIQNYRPIGLCNTNSKIISKIITNRLKPLLGNLIRPHQAAFLPKRRAADNIIITQEILRFIQKYKGLKHFMIIKLDMEKAFDRIEWSFIKTILHNFQFPTKFIKLILHCITTTTLQILINGRTTDPLIPSRGIRQGDPISPYICILCMEYLSCLINEVVFRAKWTPIRLTKDSPPISHLFFADDIILFAEATLPTIQSINDILNYFCKISGQKINNEKSKILFSPNTSKSDITKISAYMNLKPTDNLGTYLGIPLSFNRKNSALCTKLIDSFNRRIQSWQHMFLNLVGQATLLRTTLFSLPIHAMQITSLPKQTLNKMRTLGIKFLWNDQADKTNLKLVSWKTVTKPLKDGGLNIPCPFKRNLALNAGLAWRCLVDNNNSLWANLIKHKYKISIDGPIKKRPNESSTMQSIRQGWAICLNGIMKHL